MVIRICYRSKEKPYAGVDDDPCSSEYYNRSYDDANGLELNLNFLWYFMVT